MIEHRHRMLAYAYSISSSEGISSENSLFMLGGAP